MAITQVGTIQAAGAKNGGAVTLTFDTALAENDVVYVVGGSNINRGNAGPNASYGYTEVYLDTTLGYAFGVWRKKMGPTPDTDVVTNATGNGADACAYGCVALRGVDTATQEDVAVTNATGTSTNPNPPSIDPTTDNCAIVIGAASNVQDAAPGAVANYATGSGNQTDTSGGFTAAIGFRVISGGGPEDPAAWDAWLSGTWRAVSVAVRPQAAVNTDRQPPQGDLILDPSSAPIITIEVFVAQADLAFQTLAPAIQVTVSAEPSFANLILDPSAPPTVEVTTGESIERIPDAATLSLSASAPVIPAGLLNVWTPYLALKRYLADGTIDIDTDAFRMALFTDDSNAMTLTLSTYSELTGEIGGTAQAASLSLQDNGATQTVACTDLTWSGEIADVKTVALWDFTSGKLVSVAQVYNTQTTIPSGSALRLSNSQGVFDLT